MTTKEIYESIDQSKISPKGKEFLQKVEKSTKGFTIENEKLDKTMRKIYSDLKERKPEALKDVKVKIVTKTETVPTTKAEQKKEPKKKTKTVKRKVKKATGKKKNTKPTKTPSTPKGDKKEHISTRASKLAKKEGISFKEARAKISKVVKEEKAQAVKQTEKELDKLLKFVRKDSFEGEEKFPKVYGKQNPEKTSLGADANRKAKPKGRRVSEKEGKTTNQYGTFKNKTGRVYYEHRDNRSDRNSLPAPRGQYKYQGATPPYLEAGGTLPTPFGQAGLVGETGTLNEVDLFAMGGDLPQGVHQYYANTYNPAYPIPHGYAKGGSIDDLHKRVEDLVRNLTSFEYEVFAFDNNIDPENANEMNDFIYNLNKKEAEKIIAQLKGVYAKGGMITSASEYQKVRNAEYDRRVKSGKIKDTNDNFERFDEMYFDELVKKGKINPKNYFGHGGMMQGYNDRLDESLGNRDGVEPMMMQSFKDRRDESKGMEKAMGRRAYQSVGTMDKMAKGGYIEDEKIIPLNEVRKNPKLKREFVRGYYLAVFEKGKQTAIGVIKTPNEIIDGRHLGNVYGEKLKNGKIKIKFGKEYYSKGGKTFERDDSAETLKENNRELKEIDKKLKSVSKDNSKFYQEEDLLKRKHFLERQNLIIKGNYIAMERSLKELSDRKKMAHGGMHSQGYNDRLDESLGNRDGVEPIMMQSFKDRRDESKGMEKAMGRRAYQSVGTMDKMAKGGEVDAFIMSYVKGVPQDDANLRVDTQKLVAKLKKGGKLKQGYNDQLDESLAMRKGNRRRKMQNYKDRRDESKAMERSMGRRAYASVGMMDKGRRRRMAKGGELKGSLRDILIKKFNLEDGRDIDNYQSDLYVLYTPEIKKFLDENLDFPKNMKFFTDNITKRRFIDIPFMAQKSYKKGGKIGFDALAKKVAKRYEGKKVPRKFQKEYGKRYSKEEAMEVGDKVASKVYRQQQK